MYTADTLSRAPLASSQEEVQGFVEGVLQSLPATKGRLEEYSTAQQKDPVCARMREYCESEWLGKRRHSSRDSTILQG